jgi:hypothetical protein
LIAASALYAVPLFVHPNNYGRADWDQFTTRYETPRTALLRDRQLPLWNPYVNGGTVLWAHPHCPAASPWYALVLCVGAPLGLRLQVLLFLILGTTGMAALLGREGVAPAGRLLAGIVFMLSSHFALHITEGHLEWCALGLMPWLIWCLRRFGGIAAVLAAGALLASVLTFGSVYVAAVYLPFFTLWKLLEAVQQRRLRGLAAWAGAVCLAVLLSGVKLLPQLEFTGTQPRETVRDGFSPRGLGLVFASPGQAFLYGATRDVILPPEYEFARTVPNSVAVPLSLKLLDMGFHEAWHEYGCYVTIPALVFAALGVVASWRRHWPLYAAGAVALLAAMGNRSPLDVWSWLQALPLYGSLHMPSRCLAAVVFVLAVAAGHGIGWLTECIARLRSRWSERCAAAVGHGVVLAVFAELVVLGWTLFGDIFICDPAAPRAAGLRIVPHRDFAVRMRESRFYHPVMTSCLYPRLMSNTGVVQGYENLAVPQGDVRVAGTPGYRGEVYLLQSEGTLAVRNWTMSRVRADIQLNAADRVVLNQNYWPGWQAVVHGRDGLRTLPAEFYDGLVSIGVRPGDESVELAYRPERLLWGALVSGATLLGCTAVVRWSWRRRKQAAPGEAA